MPGTVSTGGRWETHRVTEQRRVLGTGPRTPGSPQPTPPRPGTAAEQTAAADHLEPEQPPTRTGRRTLGTGPT